VQQPHAVIRVPAPLQRLSNGSLTALFFQYNRTRSQYQLLAGKVKRTQRAGRPGGGEDDELDFDFGVPEGVVNADDDDDDDDDDFGGGGGGRRAQARGRTPSFRCVILVRSAAASVSRFSAAVRR
jgi:hypothetical protein